MTLAPVVPTRIQLCGPTVIEWDGQRVEGRLPGRQGRSLFAFLDEETVPEVELFVTQWPRIHEVIPAKQRTYRLAPDARDELRQGQPEFAHWCRQLGYDDSTFVPS